MWPMKEGVAKETRADPGGISQDDLTLALKTGTISEVKNHTTVTSDVEEKQISQGFSLMGWQALEKKTDNRSQIKST